MAGHGTFESIWRTVSRIDGATAPPATWCEGRTKSSYRGYSAGEEVNHKGRGVLQLGLPDVGRRPIPPHARVLGLIDGNSWRWVAIRPRRRAALSLNTASTKCRQPRNRTRPERSATPRRGNSRGSPSGFAPWEISDEVRCKPNAGRRRVPVFVARKAEPTTALPGTHGWPQPFLNCVVSRMRRTGCFVAFASRGISAASTFLRFEAASALRSRKTRTSSPEPMSSMVQSAKNLGQR